jgi:hypothetical protein
LHLLLLLYVGYSKGWWKTASDSPIAKGVGAGHAGPAAAPEVGEGEGDDEKEDGKQGTEAETVAGEMGGDGALFQRKVGVAASRAQHQKERQKVGNTLLFAAKVLARPLNIRLFRGMAALPKPLMAATAGEMSMLRTALGPACARLSRSLAPARS